jgi:endonuclease/exonuclease/phosphatase family metal-dependent hydrolase
LLALATLAQIKYIYTMAGRILRRFFKRFFVVINSLIAGLFLLSCLVPYLNPSHWWFVGFLGLMVPYLATLLIFSIFFWWVIKPFFSLIPIITLLIGWKQLSVLFAVNKNQNFTEKKGAGRLRIVDWNIRSFEGLSQQNDKKRIDRMSIVEAILSQNPDVICLQEFNHSRVQDNLALFHRRFPYHYFSQDFEKNSIGYKAGSVIFSKYPIVDSAKFKYPGSLGESLIYADIETPEDTIRVFTTHLQSFKFSQQDYEGMEKIKNNEEKALDASRGLFQKMKIAFTRRGDQARIVRNALDSSIHPSVICGDFNDVPNGFTYYHIRKNWQDAFLKTSLGIGRTYIALAPTLRIDYILPDNQFSIHQFDMVDEGLSDHLMLVADLSLVR